MGRDERLTDDSVLDRQTKPGLLSQRFVTWIKPIAIGITGGLLGGDRRWAAGLSRYLGSRWNSMRELEEWLEDPSPSTKLVVKVLENHGSLTQKEIIRHSRLHGRTVRYALENLECAGIVEKSVCIDDARQNQYQLLTSVSCERADNRENHI